MVDSAGNAYLAGQSGADDFPTTPGAWQAAFHGGEYDAVVVKVNAEGSDLLYSTYLGGAGTDRAQGSSSTTRGTPMSPESPRRPISPPPFPGSRPTQGWDLFVAELNQDASALLFGTYFGGSGDEYLYSEPFWTGLDLTSHGVVIAGPTASTDLPTTAGAYDVSFNGGEFDGFVTRLEP